MSGCLVASGGRFDWAQRAWGCVFGTARERGKSGRTPNHVSHGCWQLCAGAEFGSCLLRENVGWRDWTTHHGPVEGNVHLFVGMGVNGSQRSSLTHVTRYRRGTSNVLLLHSGERDEVCDWRPRMRFKMLLQKVKLDRRSNGPLHSHPRRSGVRFGPCRKMDVSGLGSTRPELPSKRHRV